MNRWFRRVPVLLALGIGLAGCSPSAGPPAPGVGGSGAPSAAPAENEVVLEVPGMH